MRTIGNLQISGSLLTSGSITATTFIGDGSGLVGVTSYTDSDTLSYINSLGVLSGSIDWDTLEGKPAGIISGSGQISSLGFTTCVGTVTSVATNNGLTGGTITSTGTIGLTGQALALHNLATNGVIARTGADTVAGRTITGGTNITVTNGDGVSGNPTISTSATTCTGTVTSVTAGTYLTGGTITTTGTIAVDATNVNTASKIVARDASGNFCAATITAALSGNASTATTATCANQLTTARTINGVSFNGTANITIPTGLKACVVGLAACTSYTLNFPGNFYISIQGPNFNTATYALADPIFTNRTLVGVSISFCNGYACCAAQICSISSNSITFVSAWYTSCVYILYE